MMSRNPKLRSAGLILLAGFVLSACEGQGQKANSTAAPPPPSVSVIVAQTQAVPLIAELPGRTVAYLAAEVRPQVTGIIKERKFNEGSEVKAGQLLYQIESSTYQATLANAQAVLARAEANLQSARQTAARYADLVKIEAVSKQANDDAIAAVELAKADVAAAKAAVEKAQIDLQYTRVTAPIAGRIGRSAVTAGALVTANQSEPLATVQQLDPIYVDLTQSSAELLRLRRALAEGQLQGNADGRVPAQLIMEDGSVYGEAGELAFSEVSVDPNTGSVALRAVFPNPRGELLPGMYVRARLQQGQQTSAILLPHAAVSRDPRGNATVMVVNDSNVAESRIIQVARSEGDKWVVTDGVVNGERVIVSGLQYARPGAPVTVMEAAPAAAPAAPVGN